MKKIYFILATLVIALSGMSYLYFSALKKAGVQADLSLELLSKNAAMIFNFQNDKSVRNILDGQELLAKILGEEKSSSLRSLKNQLERLQSGSQFQGQNIYIGFYPGVKRSLEYMIGMQMRPEANDKVFAAQLKQAGITLSPYSSYQQLQTADDQTFYLLIQKRVVLIASAANVIDQLIAQQQSDADKDFLTFIQKNDRLAKNSLANLYINVKAMGPLMKAITPYFNRGELAVLSRQQAFARLSYNFSKEKVFFSGETKPLHPADYFGIFAAFRPEKIELDRILPASTANYTLYSFGEYKQFNKVLQQWFVNKKEDKNVSQKVAAINERYRLNLNDVFLKFASSQAATFQLQNKQKLAAIKLNSGEKVEQLLLDISDDYDGEIRLMKEPDILYYYFGEPFKNFRKPYYQIINNYMIIGAFPSSIIDFRNSYQQNRLLSLEPGYTDVFRQLPSTSNILFYLNINRSQQNIISTIYPQYYTQIRSKNGLKAFDSFVYQLGGDQGTFQTNLLLTTKRTSAIADESADNSLPGVN